MRESRLYGSVRGALGDRRPYRDPTPSVNHSCLRSMKVPGHLVAPFPFCVCVDKQKGTL